ncbi:MAG: lipopolysaccharide biosynthesis protein, partial [Sphingobacteriaceae bacterium]
MNINRFLKLLYRHRFILVAVPLLALVLTYFLTLKLPNVYVSTADIATGIVDPTQQVLGSADGVQESKVNQQFSNLLGTIRLGKVIDQVSYSLIIHDLANPNPFRPKSKLLQQLNSHARAHALETFKKKYQQRAPLDLTDPDEAGLESVLAAQQYDAESLKKNLTVYRADNSDFVHLEFPSEQPQLSAFVLNSLCKEFIAYTSSSEQKNKGNANEFLQKLVKQKLDTMNAKVAALKNYKIQNHILDLK